MEGATVATVPGVLSLHILRSGGLHSIQVSSVTVMPSSATRCSSAKVLLLVAVLHVVSINAVFATSVSKGDVQALKTRDDGNAERFLRSDTTMTVDEQANGLKERALAATAGLEQGATGKITNFIQNLKLSAGKKSPLDSFKIFELNRAGENVFKSTQFLKWAKFVTETNTKNPEVAMFGVLATRYSDDVLAKMFAAAKEVDNTKVWAAKLQGVQLASWENAGKSSNYVFKALNLRDTGRNVFTSPVFSTWTTYVARIKQGDANDVIFIKLVRRFGSVALAKMIAAATKVDSMNKLATDLRSIQFNGWLEMGGTLKKVNKMIRVTANSDNLTKKVARDYRKFYVAAKAVEH